MSTAFPQSDKSTESHIDATLGIISKYEPLLFQQAVVIVHYPKCLGWFFFSRRSGRSVGKDYVLIKMYIFNYYFLYNFIYLFTGYTESLFLWSLFSSSAEQGLPFSSV